MIVGLAGRCYSGKDTSGALLVKELGFSRVAFADAVKEFAAKLFDWPLEHVTTDAFKRNTAVVPLHAGMASLTGRELLQRIGTDAARAIFGEDCWVKDGITKCSTLCLVCGEEERRAIHYGTAINRTCSGYQPQHHVITDVRFPNEYDAIKATGGKVIRLNRADREHVHDYEDYWQGDGAPNGASCVYMLPNGRFCGLPPAAHPSHYSDDTHESETSLPDESNERIKYDAVIEATSGKDAALQVLKLCCSWMEPVT